MNFRDYAWINGYPGWIDNGYCITLIRELSDSSVLDHLRIISDRKAVSGFADIQLEEWDFMEDGIVELGRSEVIGVADAGDGWTVMVEQNSGYLGITEDLMRPIVAGHEVFVLYKNIEALSRFVWWKDGRKQVDFETRLGAPDVAQNAVSPEVAASVIEAIGRAGGLPLTDDDEPGDGYSVDQGALALASELGGVNVTADLFSSGSFVVAVVPTTLEIDTPPVYVETVGIGAPTWSRIVRMHRNAMKNTTIHAVATEFDEHRNPEALSFEFWFKPRRSWMLSDSRGYVFVQNRRGEHWFRKNGELIPRGDEGFSLPLWPGNIIDFLHDVVLDFGPSANAETIIEPETLGTETLVDGRPAWEFRLPDIMRGIPRHIAFDQQTGVIVWRVQGSNTGQLTDLTVGELYDDDMFNGDRYCKPAE